MSLDQGRAQAFCRRFGLKLPIVLAPMAGACPPSLSIAVMKVGSLGACGALLMPPNEIAAWANEVRAEGNGPFQFNLWIPDPPPRRDRAHEDQVRAFLERFGPAVAANAGDAAPLDFAAQCEALLATKPAVVSSIMGLYPPDFVDKLKKSGIAWFATVSTVAEARAAEERRCRCRGCARHGSRRPSRLFRCRPSGKAIGRPICARSRCRRCGQGPGGGNRRHCRCARCCGRLVAGRQRR